MNLEQGELSPENRALFERFWKAAVDTGDRRYWPALNRLLDAARAEGRSMIEASPSGEGSKREEIARIISGPVCDATGGTHDPVRDGRYQFCAKCGETLKAQQFSRREALAKADAILALSPSGEGGEDGLSGGCGGAGDAA
jgi:hypothetical protein